jgi:hypothetical protein
MGGAVDMRPPVVMMTMITMMTKNLALLKVIITARTVQLEDIQLSPAALVHRTT